MYNPRTTARKERDLGGGTAAMTFDSVLRKLHGMLGHQVAVSIHSVDPHGLPDGLLAKTAWRAWGAATKCAWHAHIS
jgi:hypothetical protein